MKEAPAILIFKENYELIERLKREERGDVLTSICEYSKTKTLPTNLPENVYMCFLALKKDIDRNERKYQEKCEYHKNYNEKKKLEALNNSSAEPSEAEAEDKPKPKGKPAREPTAEKTASEAVSQSEWTTEQKKFLKDFKEALPNKEIDCEVPDYSNIDLNALMVAIKQSPQYLMNPEKNKNLSGLRWYLENADKIIAGTYRKFEEAAKPTPAKNQSPNTYSKEQLNEIFNTVKIFKGGEND